MTSFTPYSIHDDRLFSADSKLKCISRDLYQSIKDLPIVSPHGHTDPRWFAENNNFSNATELLIIPDHYVFRMLYSQGVSLESLGIKRLDGSLVETDYRKIWRCFAKHYYLFHGTPSRMWMDHVLCSIFGFEVELTEDSADYFYDRINEILASDEFKPRALLDKFNIELLATTEGGLDDLTYHAQLKGTGIDKTVITTFRPDDIVDPESGNFANNLHLLAEKTGQDCASWQGYLAAIRNRRAFFREHGATASDHGHATAKTADLTPSECERLFNQVRSGNFTAEQAELFRAQMLTELAGMSLEDGMVMQIHPGVYRNHNSQVFKNFGRDKGGDIPVQAEFVHNMQPLLNKYGNSTDIRIILFTLDETTYTRELAPLAGHYPALKLGPAWWFHDSPEGMLRYRHAITETAGLYNTVGFNDDTRAFLSIPARHDVARRIDCRFLAQMVAEHRISESAAFDLAHDLTYRLAKEAYQNTSNK
ncbi:glucuronate isomerase [Catenovulum agarivorans]|uniref:glucuronate isomerase n=1 Tax=Catenovulum agarivorans TaxID=1172192 RepID=UPI0002F2B596|nr:glucuronate isomerase [Catenovulum agarivorans]